MTKLPLTVIILTNRNDQRFVNALQSGQFAEEVLVVDNHSGNDWKKLAKKNRFRLIKYTEKIENFAQVRNFALEKATYEWVFFLDSDEIIPVSEQPAIQRAIKNGKLDGAFVKRTDVFMGKQLRYGEAGKQRILRLFKRDLGHFNRAVHEVAKVNGKVGNIDVTIIHHAHVSISEFISTVSWYAQQIGFNRSFLPHEVLLELLIYPPGKFIFNYIFALGFLDGWRGLIYALVMSMHSAAVRVYAYEKEYAETL